MLTAMLAARLGGPLSLFLVVFGAAAVTTASGTAAGEADSRTATEGVSGHVRVTVRGKPPSATPGPPTSSPGIAQKIEGTFSLTGVLQDTGAAVVSPKPQGTSLREVYRLRGKRGSLRLLVTLPSPKTPVPVTPGTPSPGGSPVGTPASWRIISGTGVYLHLRGSGRAKTARLTTVLVGVLRSA
jgi:hypothetical protein